MLDTDFESSSSPSITAYRSTKYLAMMSARRATRTGSLCNFRHSFEFGSACAHVHMFFLLFSSSQDDQIDPSITMFWGLALCSRNGGFEAYVPYESTSCSFCVKYLLLILGLTYLLVVEHVYLYNQYWTGTDMHTSPLLLLLFVPTT